MTIHSHGLEQPPLQPGWKVDISPPEKRNASPLIHFLADSNSGNQSLSADGLQRELIAGLRSVTPSLPSMLLWDDAGIRRFNTLTLDPNYYPSRTEMDLVTRHAEEIAMMTPPDSVLIELGCGNLRKTSIILSAFDRLSRPVRYYALDMSGGALQQSLQVLVKTFAHSNAISISGLHATYDDCVAWIRSSPPALAPRQARSNVVSFLWLGNSIANLEPDDASALLANFHDACADTQLECRFLIGSDACADCSTVRHSYGPNYKAITDFIFSGLEHANRLLGADTLPPSAFRFVSEFQVQDRHLQVYYVAQRQVVVPLDGGDDDLVIAEGQKIAIIHSYKWSPDDMRRICTAAGLEARPGWKDPHIDYYLYTASPRQV
ncbi:hypothetical protein FE257_001924 [Aspergillus nanangensis]|uniref:4-dimethylallyltryptophan N-methyltransferase n=1 Tax=Aspergillus nanangensis TaxID=2582783 RepID=A0AAD4GNL0_ASPNN|nr:hypothetical protein FE257_001924 [Aspergillus nanangensis]